MALALPRSQLCTASAADLGKALGSDHLGGRADRVRIRVVALNERSGANGGGRRSVDYWVSRLEEVATFTACPDSITVWKVLLRALRRPSRTWLVVPYLSWTESGPPCTTSRLRWGHKARPNIAAWVELARKRALIERNPDPRLVDDEYRTTVKGRDFVRSRWSRWLRHPLTRTVGGWTGGGAVGALISAGIGGLFGASLVQVIEGGATDTESGVFGASIALLLVSLFRTLEEMRRELPVSSRSAASGFPPEQKRLDDPYKWE
jgi:hypothetical protein